MYGTTNPAIPVIASRAEKGRERSSVRKLWVTKIAKESIFRIAISGGTLK